MGSHGRYRETLFNDWGEALCILSKAQVEENLLPQRMLDKENECRDFQRFVAGHGILYEESCWDANASRAVDNTYANDVLRR
jgi:hypothetical protein